ncbi:hypothetical protein AB1287_17195 [Enterobacter asburiae]|uniref:hypothetical protein n=1 Tax=Scandinavium sp. UTDF21-P1B TaxID=3446379 RepID=UPI00347A8E3E
MSVRIFFILLITFIMGGGGLFYAIQDYQEKKLTPQVPCYSVIREGNFIDDNLQPYSFNGGLTWWPYQKKLSVFGISKNSHGGKVINRILNLGDVRQHQGTIHARVAAVDIAAGDQLGKEYTLFSATGTPLTLTFKPLTDRKWLMMINDNWIAMCEKK